MPARKNGPLTAQQTEKIRAAYREGVTLRTLATRYRCALSTIWKHVEPRRPSELVAARARIRELESEVAALRAALECAGVA